MKTVNTLNVFLTIAISSLLFNSKNLHSQTKIENNIKHPINMKTNYKEYKAIEKGLQSYLTSPNTAKASGLLNDWYEHLYVVGEINDHVINMSRNEFIALIESQKSTPKTKGKIVMIDIGQNAACAKLEFITPNGFRFTDYILMYKENNIWKASAKVFDTNIHYNNQTQETSYTEYEAIEKTLQNYLNAAKTGDGEKLKTNWLEHATIVGEYGKNIITVFRKDFIQAITHLGAAPTIGSHIVSINYNGKAAYAKVLINDWLGVNYTDYLVLHKQNNKWVVAGKVYDINK